MHAIPGDTSDGHRDGETAVDRWRTLSGSPVRIVLVVLMMTMVMAMLVLSGCARGTRMQTRFDEHDQNGDGFLAPEEFRQTRIAARSESPDALFREIDADGDQLLSLDEILRHVQTRR